MGVSWPVIRALRRVSQVNRRQSRSPGRPGRYRREVNGRRTNLALLALLPLALLTGFAGFAVGTPTVGAAIVVFHGAVGLAVAVLSPWKSVVVRRGLRRARPGRWASLVLAALVVAVVVTGVAHSGGLRGVGQSITTMQIHVGAALLAIPFAVWHALARPARPGGQDLSRRSLVRALALGAAAGAMWTAAEATWSATGTRGARRRFTGSHETGSGDPLAMPVTQWLFDRVPDLDAQVWRLRVGRGGGKALLRLEDLAPLERMEASIDCTGGWWARQEWEGVRLDRLLGPPGGAISVVVTAATGYRRRFPVSDLATLWLATRCAGAPLSAGHGAPARLVAPGRRGFWWVKWVVAVELDDVPAWRQPPFPLQ